MPATGRKDSSARRPLNVCERGASSFYRGAGPVRNARVHDVGVSVVAFLVCERWNRVEEWIREIALLLPGHSWIWLPTVDVFRTCAKSEEAPGA